MKKHLFLPLLLFALSPLSSMAGNKWMMEKNGQELLMVNKQLISTIDKLPANGEIEIKARVIFQNGKPTLQLDEVKSYKKDTDLKSINFSHTNISDNYKVFIREASLPEIPVINDANK